MKVKLLKRLRRDARNKIRVISTTTTNGVHSGSSYSYSDNDYSGLRGTKEELLKQAEHIFIENYIKRSRNL